MDELYFTLFFFSFFSNNALGHFEQLSCFSTYHTMDNSADDKLVTFFLFFLENRIWHFMKIVSLGDNLHEVSNPIFLEK